MPKIFALRHQLLEQQAKLLKAQAKAGSPESSSSRTTSSDEEHATSSGVRSLPQLPQLPPPPPQQQQPALAVAAVVDQLGHQQQPRPEVIQHSGLDISPLRVTVPPHTAPSHLSDQQPSQLLHPSRHRHSSSGTARLFKISLTILTFLNVECSCFGIVEVKAPCYIGTIPPTNRFYPPGFAQPHTQ